MVAQVRHPFPQVRALNVATCDTFERVMGLGDVAVSHRNAKVLVRGCDIGTPPKGGCVLGHPTRNPLGAGRRVPPQRPGMREVVERAHLSSPSGPHHLSDEEAV